MECTNCNIDMEPLVAGIYQCPSCKKISKEKTEIVKEEKKKKKVGSFEDSSEFPKLNPKFEVVVGGITINKSPQRWLAVLICHSAYLKSEKYVRISWWKKSFYQHGGMMKIYDAAVLKNIISALEKIDEEFDEVWNWKGRFGRQKSKSQEQLDREQKIDIIKYRIIENRTCPKCQKKMVKMKSHYECQHCGEIVILEGYNQPIFNISPSNMDLTFHTNFPINFYLPISGITVKWLMGEWKSLVVIYSKDNPNKKWLRFYWWARNLSNILKHGQREIGDGIQMGWKAQKGAGSPNIYDKKLIKPLITALKSVAEKINWAVN